MFWRAKKIETQIETQVEKVLATNSVGTAKKLMQSRSGAWVVAVISFIESALPIPILTDPFIVAAILVDRANTMRIIVVAIITSVMGGVAAYYMAYFSFALIMSWMTPGMTSQFETLVATNQSSTFILTLIGAVTPVPYTIVAWVVAVINGNILVFIAASLLGRGLRYAIVGVCVYRFGPLAISYAKKYIGITSVIVCLLAALVIWLKM